jgi:TPR repeat protein
LDQFYCALEKGEKSIGSWLRKNCLSPVVLNKYVWLNIGIYYERCETNDDMLKALDYYKFVASESCAYACLRYADVAYYLYERRGMSLPHEKTAFKMCIDASKWLKGKLKGKALNLLGCFHIVGYGCRKNKSKGLRYYKEAVKLGNMTAKHNLEYFLNNKRTGAGTRGGLHRCSRTDATGPAAWSDREGQHKEKKQNGGLARKGNTNSEGRKTEGQR